MDLGEYTSRDLWSNPTATCVLCLPTHSYAQPLQNLHEPSWLPFAPMQDGPGLGFSRFIANGSSSKAKYNNGRINRLSTYITMYVVPQTRLAARLQYPYAPVRAIIYHPFCP